MSTLRKTVLESLASQCGTVAGAISGGCVGSPNVRFVTTCRQAGAGPGRLFWVDNGRKQTGGKRMGKQ